MRPVSVTRMGVAIFVPPAGLRRGGDHGFTMTAAPVLVLRDDHATGTAASTPTSFVTTLMLPCVAFEYGHVRWAVSTIFCAASRSIPGRLTFRRAWRKYPPRVTPRSTSASTA